MALKFVTKATFTPEDLAAAPELEPALESLLRSLKVHDSVIEATRINEILDRAIFSDLAQDEGKMRKCAAAFGIDQSDDADFPHQREMAKLLGAWRTARTQNEVKLNVDAAAKAHGEPIAILAMDWNSLMVQFTSYWLFEVFVLGRGFRFHSSDCAREGKPGHGENPNEGRLLCGTRQQTERPREKQVRKPVQSRKLRARIGGGSFQAGPGNGPETQILVVELVRICHCGERQSCHAYCLIEAYEKDFPGAFNRSDLGSSPPSSQQLNYLARLREEVPSDDGSSADEGSAPKNSGWIGKGYPLQVGVGYTVRDYCDGQSLCSPGRWALAARRYPETET